MKRILFAIALATLAGTAIGQSLRRHAADHSIQRNTHVTLQAQPLMADAPRKALASNQVLLGSYTNDSYITNLSNSSGFPRYPGTLKVANVISADKMMAYNGTQIVQMRVALAMAAGQSVFFIAPVGLDGSIGSNIFETTVSATKAGWNTVSLPAPYTIDTKAIGGLLLGFSYKQLNTNNGQYYNDECYPLSIMAAGEECPILVSGINGSDAWEDFGTACLSVQAVVEGSFATNAAQPSDYGNVLIPLGKSISQDIQLRNMGKDGIKNINYTISANGETGKEQYLKLSTPVTDFNAISTVTLNFASAAKEGTEQRILTITKINGKPNEATVQTAQGLVASTSTTVPRRVTVEEFTGTGCGWCPRGLVGMENLRQQFGDRFIGIALHQYNGDDPMYISSNNYAALPFHGAPSALVDRSGDTDPYYGAANAVEYMLSVPAKVDVDVVAEWNATGTQVEAQVTATSPIEGSSFDIEYVLVADGLYSSAWKQANYYSSAYASQTGMSKSSLESDLVFLWNKGTSYAPTFNDVALSSSYTGGVNQAQPLSGLHPSTPTTNSFTLNVPSKLRSYIDKEQVYVVALVTDGDGTITNSAKCAVAAHGTGSGIGTTTVCRPARTEYFSTDGRLLHTPQRGVNIVRHADGRTRKVLVR